MRQISVSNDVFALIWSARKTGEDDEDSILRRVLSDSLSASQRRPIVSEGEPQADVGQTQKIKEAPARVSSSADTNAPKSKDIGPHAPWWQVVHAALSRMGGQAQLRYLYVEVAELCGEIGKKIPRTLDATVRGTLEDNCADSERYKYKRDVFCMPEGKGKGVWAIK